LTFNFSLKDDELDEEKSLLDSTHDEILKSPSDSTKSTSPEVPPSKPISLKRNISIAVPVIETKPSEDEKASTETNSDEPDKKVVKISELTAKDRLELRAKKFAGSVGSSGSGSDSGGSQGKLAARAARFGVSAPTAESKTAPVTSSVSLDVLKKRAERFGAVLVPELKKAETDEKLQKRQERFGASGKVLITGPTTEKSDVEERALKRLERFKQTA
jgi:SAP domain-containing ribonucleoprotein